MPQPPRSYLQFPEQTKFIVNFVRNFGQAIGVDALADMLQPATVDPGTSMESLLQDAARDRRIALAADLQEYAIERLRPFTLERKNPDPRVLDDLENSIGAGARAMHQHGEAAKIDHAPELIAQIVAATSQEVLGDPEALTIVPGKRRR